MYRLVLLLLISAVSAFGQIGGSAGWNSPPVNPPFGSAFAIPAQNPCRSAYDRFYSTEPGVYAYWALCDSGSSYIADTAQDTAGVWGLKPNVDNGHGGAPNQVAGPVPDGEMAGTYASTDLGLRNGGFYANQLSGTIAAWVNGGASGYPFYYVTLSGQSPAVPCGQPQQPCGQSYIGLGRCTQGTLCAATDSSECFVGWWNNMLGVNFSVQQCGYTPNVWHRLVYTWSGTAATPNMPAAGTLTLAVDGAIVGSAPYTGAIDQTQMDYQLFSNNASSSTTTTMAKALIANQAWTASQIAADYAPNFAPQTPPAGGVVVTATQLATVHQDVAGVADSGTDLTSAGQAALVKAGYQALGIKAVRYAGGNGGIYADATDWTGISQVQCTHSGQTGGTAPAHYLQPQSGYPPDAWGDTLDNFMALIGTPLGLDLMYTVNYGSNPPACNAGGDPIQNGQLLAQHMLAKSYTVRSYQIGNEQWAQSSNIDLHPNPYYTSADHLSTYPQYEAAFYNAIKAVQAVDIDVPFPDINPNTQANNTYLYPLMAAGKYDAVDIHLYPRQPFEADADILYPELESSGADVGQSPTDVRGQITAASTLLASYGKDPSAIHVGEWDFATSGNTWSRLSQSLSSALASATMLAEFAREGVKIATWWANGSPNGCSTYNIRTMDAAGNVTNSDGSDFTTPTWVYGTKDCGSHALLFTGQYDGGGTNIGMVPGDLFPAGRGFQVMTHSGYLTEGEQSLLTFTDTNARWLNAFAVTHAKGTGYAVLLVNRDTVGHTVPVKTSLATWSTGTQTTYGAAQYALTAVGNWSAGPSTTVYTGGSGMFYAILPAMSASVVVIQ